jgi:hypothetical protein
VKETLELIEGIWVAASALTCVVEKFPNWVELKAPIPVVVKAATCVVVSDAIEVCERLWMAAVDSARICATERAEMDIGGPSWSVVQSTFGRRAECRDRFCDLYLGTFRIESFP